MHYFISAFAMGSIYALMALAINIVYSVTGIINFAHAIIITVGAMTSFYCLYALHLPYLVALLIGIIVTAFTNFLVYKTCVEKLKNLTTNLGWIVTTFGASILLENVLRMVFGTEPQVFPYLFGGKMISFLGAPIMIHEFLILAIAIVAGVTYETVIQKTRFGRAVRAVAFKPEIAQLMGVRSNMVVTICFSISGAIAAIAGVLIAPITFVNYTMTTFIGLKGFAAALIGGLGNSKGAFIGGLILGLIEALVGMYGPVALKNAFSFAVMIIVIIFLPGGLLGAKFFTKQSTTAKI